MRVFGEFHVGPPLKEIGWSGKRIFDQCFPSALRRFRIWHGRFIAIGWRVTGDVLNGELLGTNEMGISWIGLAAISGLCAVMG